MSPKNWDLETFLLLCVCVRLKFLFSKHFLGFLCGVFLCFSAGA